MNRLYVSKFTAETKQKIQMTELKPLPHARQKLNEWRVQTCVGRVSHFVCHDQPSHGLDVKTHTSVSYIPLV